MRGAGRPRCFGTWGKVNGIKDHEDMFDYGGTHSETVAGPFVIAWMVSALTMTMPIPSFCCSGVHTGIFSPILIKRLKMPALASIFPSLRPTA